MNVARVAINRHLMCGQNCNSVKCLFIPNLRFVYITYFGNLLFLPRAGLNRQPLDYQSIAITTTPTVVYKVKF
jgi:hypothetical protein